MKKAVVTNQYGHFLHANQDVWVKEYPDAGQWTFGEAVKIAYRLGERAIQHYGYNDAIIYEAIKG
jgi:hypothetical protein